MPLTVENMQTLIDTGTGQTEPTRVETYGDAFSDVLASDTESEPTTEPDETGDPNETEEERRRREEGGGDEGTTVPESEPAEPASKAVRRARAENKGVNA